VSETKRANSHTQHPASTEPAAPWWAAGSIFLGLAAAAPLLLHAGFLNTRSGGDSPFLLFRLHQLYRALADGVFPVRWMPDAAFGLGYPFFSYYAALPYYAAALFHWLGLTYVLSLKLTHLLGFLIAAWGMHRWAKKLTGRPAAAFLASAAYTFAPYHLVNVYLRGDSLAEFWAMAWLPWIMLAIHSAARRPTARHMAGVGLAFGALVMTHNVSALIAAPFIALYALLSAGCTNNLILADEKPHPREALLASLRPLSTGGEGTDRARRPGVGARSGVRSTGMGQALISDRARPAFRRVLPLAAGGLLGLALAAWVWLPALAEQGFVQLEAQTTGYFFYGNHFRGADLVQPSVLFNYDTGSEVGSPFSMGLAQAILTVGGALLLGAGMIRSKAYRRDGFLLAGLLIATWMVTPLSTFAWDHLPLLPLTQFPWRFLSIQALFSAAVIGVGWAYLPALLSERPRGTPILRYAAPTLACLMAAAGLGGLRLDFIPLADADMTPERLGWYESFSGNIGTTIRYEYLPTWTRPRPYSSDMLLGREPHAKFLSGAGDAQRSAAGAASQTWEMAIWTPTAQVALPLLYWPGWQAAVDGEPVPAEPVDGLGYIQLEVPQGAHTIQLRLGRTPLRLSAELVSLGALIAALILLRPRAPKLDWQGWSLVGSAALAIFALRLILHSLPEPENTGLLNADFAQEAYFYRAADGIRLADGRTLEAVDLNLSDGSFDYDLNLRGNDSAEGFTLSLAAPPQQQEQGLVESSGGELPPTPGLYFPLLTTGDTHALTGAGQARGEIYLAPVIIPPAPPSPTGESPVGGSGEVALRAWDTEADQNGLTVTLDWEAEAEIPQNYALALRLYDAQGSEWAGLDTQAGGAGMYPTGLWSPGEVVGERYRLALPHGTPPGSYTLYATLYDAATLRVTSQNEAPVRIDFASPYNCEGAAAMLYGEIGIDSVGLPERATVGEGLPVEVGWVATGPPEQAYRAAWRLTSDDGETAWEFESKLAPGSDPRAWAAGECGAYVLGRHRFELPGDLPPGGYTLSLRLVGENGDPLGEYYEAGQLAIEERARVFDLPEFDTPVGATFGGQIRLWGYSLDQSGNRVTLDVAWGALAAPDADYKYFVHLFDPATERIAAQLDSMPRDYTYPTSLWVPDEVVAERLILDVSEVPPGSYRIALGWYDPATAIRLAALAPDGAPLAGDRVILDEEITIR
jgi:hypothetical protein